MSAKGRAVVDPTEYYPTPPGAVAAVLPFVGAPTRIVDLGCGIGEIGRKLRRRFQRAEIVGVEIDPRRAAAARVADVGVFVDGRADVVRVYDRVVEADLLSPLLGGLPRDLGSFELVIANPPFSHAEAFLALARELLAYGGTIALLLRAVWSVPAVREKVLRAGARPDFDLVMLRERPFPDATEYAWHIWRPSNPLHGGRWMVR